MDESVLVPTEPVTIVLSEKGWVRQAKGHEIDGKELSYKAGDAFLQAAKGRSNQQAVFLDTTGRTYSTAAHTLPSARGQGEPLSSQFTPPPGATFVSVMTGPEEDLYLLASSAGYGFVVKLGELHSRNRAGKAVLTVPSGSVPLVPQKVNKLETDLLAAATDGGRLLIFPLSELPLLPKGKGVKIVSLPANKGESLVALTPLPPGAHLIVRAGQRYLNLKPSEWAEFTGNRALRGSTLPRGFQKVVGLEVG
jgi:topoisomerase IV subunit A